MDARDIEVTQRSYGINIFMTELCNFIRLDLEAGILNDLEEC